MEHSGIAAGGTGKCFKTLPRLGSTIVHDAKDVKCLMRAEAKFNDVIRAVSKFLAAEMAVEPPPSVNDDATSQVLESPGLRGPGTSCFPVTQGRIGSPVESGLCSQVVANDALQTVRCYPAWLLAEQR